MRRKFEPKETAGAIKESAVQYAMAKALEEDAKISHENEDSRLKNAINHFLDNYEAYIRRG